MIETSSDMIFETGGEGSLDSSPILPLPPPDFPEMPPSDDSMNCMEQIPLPWVLYELHGTLPAVATAGYLSWRLIEKHNEIPPSI